MFIIYPGILCKADHKWFISQHAEIIGWISFFKKASMPDKCFAQISTLINHWSRRTPSGNERRRFKYLRRDENSANRFVWNSELLVIQLHLISCVCIDVRVRDEAHDSKTIIVDLFGPWRRVQQYCGVFFLICPKMPPLDILCED